MGKTKRKYQGVSNKKKSTRRRRQQNKTHKQVKQQRRRRHGTKPTSKLNNPDNEKHENTVKREVVAIST